MTENEMIGWHHRRNGMGLSKLFGSLIYRDACQATVHWVAKSWT